MIGLSDLDCVMDELLAPRDYPIVHYRPSNVLVCRRGVWAHGGTLQEALRELDRKWQELGR